MRRIATVVLLATVSTLLVGCSDVERGVNKNRDRPTDRDSLTRTAPATSAAPAKPER